MYYAGVPIGVYDGPLCGGYLLPVVVIWFEFVAAIAEYRHVGHGDNEVLLSIVYGYVLGCVVLNFSAVW